MIIEFLDSRELGPSDVLGCLHHPLLRFAVNVLAFAVPRGDAAIEDALNGAAVEMFENLRAHAKAFQPSESEEALLCPLHDCAGAWTMLQHFDVVINLCIFMFKFAANSRVSQNYLPEVPKSPQICCNKKTNLHVKI